MPTYPYRCEKCGHTFDLFQKITEDPVKDCPACLAKGEVRREIGGGSSLLRFEGSGYYATDYKKEAPKAHKSSCACCKPQSPKEKLS